MTYAMERLTRDIRAIGPSRLGNVAEYMRRFPDLTAEACADGGDSYPEMPLRGWFKLMEAAEFEPLFERASIKKRGGTSFCYGRAAEGVTVVFTSRNGNVSSATAEMSVSSGSSCFAYSAQDVTVFADYHDAGAAPSRVRFDADAGFLLKLHSIARAFPQRLPFWWTQSAYGLRHTVGAPLMSTADRWSFYYEAGDKLLYEESARRMSVLPDAWKYRLDADGRRSFYEAMHLAHKGAAA